MKKAYLGNHKGRIYPRIWMKKAHLITHKEGPAQEEGRTGGSFPEVNDVLDPFPSFILLTSSLK
jgi:hypothetical protein